MTKLPASTLTHLECSICGARHECDELQTICRECGRALFARYDLDAAKQTLTREGLGGREASMWRYAEVMPASELAGSVSLGEGMTPLLAAPRLGAELGCSDLLVKDEGGNPTGSFKARGIAAAMAMAVRLGREGHRYADCRQCRLRRGRVLGAQRHHRPRRDAGRHAGGDHPGSHEPRRRPAARRRADQRRRTGDRRGLPRARLVRDVHAQGALPRRGQEDDGLRAVGAARRRVAGRRALPDRRRDRADRDVEGLRRAGADGPDRQRAASHVRGAIRWLRANRAGLEQRRGARRAVGRTRRRSRPASACPHPSPTI